MTTGAVPVAARQRIRQHAPVAEYDAYLEQWIDDPVYRRMLRHYRDEFIANYPDVEAWFAAPLFERVGHQWLESGVSRSRQTVCHRARSYLHYLGLRGNVWFDWDWLMAIARHRIWELDERLGLSIRRDADALVHQAIQLGYFANTAVQTLRWTLSRLLLHAGDPRVEAITDDQLDDFADAIRQFGDRPDIATFFGSRPRYVRLTGQAYLNYVHALRVVLYHRGQLATEPRRTRGGHKLRPARRPRMETVAARFLATRRLTDRPTTVASLEHALREFIAWLCTAEPECETFAEVTRDQVLAYGEFLATTTSPHTGRPYAVLSRRGRLSALAVFFRDVAQWRWEDGPSHPLLAIGDLPKIPQRVPRYIPEAELARLMDAVRALQCPFQRAALLIARWSGARRDEVRRLALDSLDAYPDGTPRLRIPAGKTKRERLVPLNEEAAAAIRNLQANRALDRGFRDSVTGIETRYLFMRHGQRLSAAYLFERPLEIACGAAGLVESNGRPSVTAHRFRHTVGTHLAERGAKLHTIMQVLGHSSASMSMVYARISDREVLRDYQAVLGPGAAIAGPFAETLRSGGLSPATVDWLKTNFFKTELELGHCLRLPQEGPCECDLYLSCAKFVTTRQYAPRLRARRQLEMELIADAEAHEWAREVERHRCTLQRLEQLLAELGEPLADTETAS
jgi:integrase